MKRMASAAFAALAAGALMVPVGVKAALPPYWQSATEISQIVNDQRVHDALKDEEPILSITLRKRLAGSRVYEIATARCKVPVTVAYKMDKPGLVGPAQFDLQVGKAACK